MRAAYLTIEDWLNVNLARQVELLRRTLATLIPLLEDLAEAHRVYFHELLSGVEGGCMW